MAFTTEQIAATIYRDGGKCSICLGRADTANHRQNRSTGGSDSLANACAICWSCNGLIESDADLAETARQRGVKLRPWDDPYETPYLSPFYGIPVWLDDDALYFTPPSARPSAERTTP